MDKNTETQGRIRLILFRLLSIMIKVGVAMHIANLREEMDYISVTKTAEKWGISTRRIRILCNEGRIPGAYKKNAYWVIPEDAEKPRDERIKSAKYVKKS